MKNWFQIRKKKNPAKLSQSSKIGINPFSSIKNSQNKINSKSTFYYCQQRFRQVEDRKPKQKKKIIIILLFFKQKN